MPTKKKLVAKSPKEKAIVSDEPLIVEEEIPENKSDVMSAPEDAADKDFWKHDESTSLGLSDSSAEHNEDPAPPAVQKEETEEDSEPQELGFLAQKDKSGTTPLSKLLWIVLAVALFVGGIGGGVLIFKEGVKAGKTQALDTPVPALEDSQTPAPTSELNRKDLSLQVLNGAGVPGAAKKAETLLEELGYEVKSTGNGRSFDYKETEIAIKDSKKDYLKLLVEGLSKEYKVSEDTTNLNEQSEFDVIITIGSD